MGEKTEISWTHHTFNPWWGCTRVSPGCVHCYAETFAKRVGVAWGPQAERRFFGDKHWNEPLKWNRLAEAAGERRRVFCASMADVFEDRPELILPRVRLWDLIAATPWLDWLLLTKRPENAARMAPAAWSTGWPRNVWAMTTAEDQQRADERIPHLLRIPAVVRGLSCEPLLGPLDVRQYLDGRSTKTGACLTCGHPVRCRCEPTFPGIDWLIAGGESGHRARPMHPEWVRSLRDQCEETATVFHFKQWGEWVPAFAQAWYATGTELPGDDETVGGDCGGPVKLDYERGRTTAEFADGTAVSCRQIEINEHRWGKGGRLSMTYCAVGKHRAGRLLDGREWNEFPEVAYA